jgi:hypothetical protein
MAAPASVVAKDTPEVISDASGAMRECYFNGLAGLILANRCRCSRQIEQDFAAIVQRSHGDATRFGRPAGWNRNQLAIIDEPFDDSQMTVARSGLGLRR